MAPIKRTPAQIANNHNAAVRGAEMRLLTTNKKKPPKYLSFASSKSGAVSNLSRNVNFNKYAKEILQNLNRKNYSLPNPNHPNFSNKVMEKVRNKYRINNPNKGAVTLNNNSIYIQEALSKIRSKLSKIKNTSTRNQTTRFPPKIVPRAVNGGGLRPNPAKATHKLFKDRHNRQKLNRAPAKKLQAISHCENKVVKNMVARLMKKVIRGANPNSLPKKVNIMTGSTRCDILHCGQKASMKNPITLNQFKSAYIGKLPDAFNQMSTGDKRLFFCKKMGSDTGYCDRVYSILF
jgi:hypothetical protein